ncbi:MAG TPA: hypothetical protein VEV17_08645 [Bryobacteraceae bacterium]|nr:hypothetical protein [Bryobacteraceae bacterium]
MPSTLLLLLGIAAAVNVAAQPAALSGPIEGFTFDAPTASLRAVIGFPGAASFGPVLLGGLDAGWVAPGRNFALLFQGGNSLLATQLDSAQISQSPIAGLAGQPDSITWSGDGSVAILYSRAGNWIQTLSGLPDNPTAGALVDLSPLGGALAAVAADQNGKQVAFAMTGNAAGVYLLTSAFTPLLQFANPIALAFSHDGSGLFALDISSMQLSLVNLTSLDSQNVPLQGLADPFAVHPAVDSQNREVVYVASRSDQLLREYDVAGQQVVADLPLYFTPTGLADFGKNSFLIAARSQPSDPLWLLASLPQPEVYFVPAVPAAAGGLP